MILPHPGAEYYIIRRSACSSGHNFAAAALYKTAGLALAADSPLSPPRHINRETQFSVSALDIARALRK